MTKILVFKRGDFYIYAYDLIMALRQQGFDVTGVAAIDATERNVIYDDLLERAQTTVPFFFPQDLPKRMIQRLRGLARRLRLSQEKLIVTPLLVGRTRRMLRKQAFDFIIAVGQESFYWACQCFPLQREKIIYYNLEIIYRGHPLPSGDGTWKAIVESEVRRLAGIGGLIIQDPQRADILLKDVPAFPEKKRIYFPVCIREPMVTAKSAYLREKFSLAPGDVVVLYFGGIWQGRFLDEIIERSPELRAGTKIVIHGGRGSYTLTTDQPNVFVSTEKLLFSAITALISSADIGLAFYPTDNFNDRYTAYSSEKISRYCQCGIPFIALDNENYQNFRARYDCCVLITEMKELPAAINTIADNYAYYRENAYRAFREVFDFDKQFENITGYLLRGPH